MKSIIFIVILFVLNLTLQAKEDLIAYWSFDDGTAKDFSGNGFDGLIVNHPIPVTGIQGLCFKFKGKDKWIYENQDKSLIGDHIILPRIPLENYPEFTISMWVKEEKLEFVGGSGYIFFGEVFKGWAGIYHAGHFPNPTSWIKYSTGSINDVDEPIKLDYNNEFNNKWMYYAIVYKNDTMYAYFNTQLVSKKYQPLLISGNRAGIATNWWFYDCGHRQSAAFTGEIDEVKIYKHALTIEEIKEKFDGSSLYFQFPDTLAAIGKDICLPMTYHTSSVGPLPDSIQYKITVSIDKSILWPNMNSSGYIVGDKRFFEFEGNLKMLNNKSIKICGTALLGNNKTTPIHFENIDIFNCKAKVFPKDGSLTLTGICQQAISQIQSIKSPKLELRQINFSNSVKAILKLYNDANIDYSIYNIYGETIIHKELGLIQKNRRELLINIINLQSGIYFIRFNINRFLFTKKLIIIDK